MATSTLSRRAAVGAAVSLIAGYAGICAVARIEYRALLYPAPAFDPAPPADADWLQVQAADGAPVRALRLRADDVQARTIVLFHSNGDTVGNDGPLAEELHRRGFGVVLPEYRGYGVSRLAGAPSEQALVRDANAVLDALELQGIGPQRVVLLGLSLGTGLAVEMARRGRGVALVLVSPYTSVPDMAQRMLPFLPAAWLCPDKFDTLSKASALRVPTLVLHGDSDEFVPFAMGRAVAAAVPGATLRAIAGGHHNDLFARHWDVMVDAIARAAASSPS
jgi:pimeloyl-ACP methyl ester carboxylesterase